MAEESERGRRYLAHRLAFLRQHRGQGGRRLRECHHGAQGDRERRPVPLIEGHDWNSEADWLYDLGRQSFSFQGVGVHHSM
jgi:hypothetical protein